MRVWRAVREGGATCRLTAKPTSVPFTHALVPLVGPPSVYVLSLSWDFSEAFQPQYTRANCGACAAQCFIYVIVDTRSALAVPVLLCAGYSRTVQFNHSSCR